MTTASSRSPSSSGLVDAELGRRRGGQPGPARRAGTSAAPHAAAGCERETPSVGERRCFSACLISSQPASTCATSPRAGVAEHVRVPADQLVDQVTGDVVDVEPAVRGGLGGDPGVEDDLQQHVAELLAHGHRVVVDDRVVGLVRLLEQVAAQRGVRLLGVPGAAAGRAQPVHHRDDVEQPRTGRLRGAGHSTAPAASGDLRRARPGRPRRPAQPPPRRRARRSTVQPVGPQGVRGRRGPGQRDERPARRRPPASRPGRAGRADGD